MAKGVIYILTNPSFPEYVKIGICKGFGKTNESIEWK